MKGGFALEIAASEDKDVRISFMSFAPDFSNPLVGYRRIDNRVREMQRDNVDQNLS
jgi:hypothetical protein